MACFACNVSVCYFIAYGVCWSLSVLHILHTGMCCLPAWYSMLVNVLFASCMSVGGCIAVKAYSVYCVLYEFVPVCLPVVSV